MNLRDIFLKKRPIGLPKKDKEAQKVEKDQEKFLKKQLKEKEKKEKQKAKELEKAKKKENKRPWWKRKSDDIDKNNPFLIAEKEKSSVEEPKPDSAQIEIPMTELISQPTKALGKHLNREESQGDDPPHNDKESNEFIEEENDFSQNPERQIGRELEDPPHNKWNEYLNTFQSKPKTEVSDPVVSTPEPEPERVPEINDIDISSLTKSENYPTTSSYKEKYLKTLITRNADENRLLIEEEELRALQLENELKESFIEAKKESQAEPTKESGPPAATDETHDKDAKKSNLKLRFLRFGKSTPKILKSEIKTQKNGDLTHPSSAGTVVPEVRVNTTATPMNAKLKNIFLKKRPIGGSEDESLKNIFCPVCKHSGVKHAYKGQSEGCSMCGCLATLEELHGHYDDTKRNLNP